jgi:Na+-translocating ferredoxin:NAD+ oxidoreductase RnfG subunit
MKTTLLATSLTLFALAGFPALALAQADTRQEPAQFQKGQSSASGKGGAPVSGRYDATGKIKCSVGNPTLDEWCDFRVVRHQPTGGAQIWISHGGKTSDRVLHFAGKKFTSDEGAALSAQRQGDSWRVNAGGKIYYLIPDAVIYGG